MAKISLVLVFALLVALPFRPVLSQDDSWKDLIGQGSFAQGGFSPETIDEAKKAFGGSGEATEDASFFEDGEEGSSLADWIDEDSVAADNTTNAAPTKSVESPVGAPEDLPADEIYDDEDGAPAEAPEDSFEENSPAGSPESSPTEAPEQAPTNAPFEAPANAPTQTPTNAPKEGNAPTDAPTESPEGEPDDDDDDSEDDSSPTEAPEGEALDASEED